MHNLQFTKHDVVHFTTSTKKINSPRVFKERIYNVKPPICCCNTEGCLGIPIWLIQIYLFLYRRFNRLQITQLGSLVEPYVGSRWKTQRNVNKQLE